MTRSVFIMLPGIGLIDLAAISERKHYPDAHSFIVVTQTSFFAHILYEKNIDRRSQMKILKMIFLLTALCSFLAFATLGCEKEGPMEKAGKKIDKTVDSAKEAVDK